MNNKLTFTDTFIKAVEKPEKRIEYYDEKAAGLILRVTKTGHKSFAFRYWYDGKSKQITIGTYGDVTLGKARDIVRGTKKMRGYKDMLRDGIDPISERQEARDHKPITLAEYIEHFKNDYVERKLKQSTQSTYKSRLNRVKAYKKLSRLPLEKIAKPDVRKFLKDEAKDNPINSNRLHSILSKLFNEAVMDGHIKENPIKGMPKLSNENTRAPVYSDDDIKEIWNAIGEEWQPVQGILKMLLLCGQRLGETSRMKWNDIQDDNWIIPITEQKTGKKTKKNHIVPLTDLALNVLDEMKPINGTSEYVFASLRDKSKPMSHFFETTERIRNKTGLDDFRIHDLRHIVATEMIEQDVPFTTVGDVLNHKALSGNNAITSRYINRQGTEYKLKALLKWHKKLNEILTGEKTTIHKIA